jgi:hypothetical protein
MHTALSAPHRLKLRQTRRKLTADVDSALKDAIIEIQRPHAQLDEAHKQPAMIQEVISAKRDKRSPNR